MNENHSQLQRSYKMLDIKAKGLFDVLNVCIGVNGNELETTMQIEVFDLSEEDQAKIVKILNNHINGMTAGDLLRKLNK
jgi:hypothetical protein